ncbi:VOC family protein [Salinicoccus siamensis]|uniref:VOC family protein n=1 Tax=Salinicoccus siamensis TaxID=381830 RepID=A0ABV5Z5Z9_9STAP
MDRINLITLSVKDISVSVDFYRKLGLESIIMGDEDEMEIIFFRMKGSKLALYPLDTLATETGADAMDMTHGFNGITLAFNAKSEAEVDHILERAKKSGGIVTREASPTSWGGYSGYFKDPDGYYWEVAYGADWEFDDDDMLII